MRAPELGRWYQVKLFCRLKHLPKILNRAVRSIHRLCPLSHAARTPERLLPAGSYVEVVRQIGQMRLVSRSVHPLHNLGDLTVQGSTLSK